MDGNRLFCITWQQPLPYPGKCYGLNYHQFSPMVERAGIFWAIPSPLTCPSPELGTQSSQFLVGVRVTVTGHPEHREQHQAPEQHIPYGKTKETAELCWLCPQDTDYLWQKASYYTVTTAQPQGRTVQCPQQPLSVLWGHHDTAAKSQGWCCSMHCNCQTVQTASLVVATYSLPATVLYWMMHLHLFPMTEPENKGGKHHGEWQKKTQMSEVTQQNCFLFMCTPSALRWCDGSLGPSLHHQLHLAKKLYGTGTSLCDRAGHWSQGVTLQERKEGTSCCCSHSANPS